VRRSIAIGLCVAAVLTVVVGMIGADRPVDWLWVAFNWSMVFVWYRIVSRKDRQIESIASQLERVESAAYELEREQDEMLNLVRLFAWAAPARRDELCERSRTLIAQVDLRKTTPTTGGTR
jgi:hypothetical protein